LGLKKSRPRGNKCTDRFGWEGESKERELRKAHRKDRGGKGGGYTAVARGRRTRPKGVWVEGNNEKKKEEGSSSKEDQQGGESKARAQASRISKRAATPPRCTPKTPDRKKKKSGAQSQGVICGDPRGRKSASRCIRPSRRDQRYGPHLSARGSLRGRGKDEPLD